MNIRNGASETIATVKSDMEAAEWWLANGRAGDYLEETDEPLPWLVNDLCPDVEWHIDSDGQVYTK